MVSDYNLPEPNSGEGDSGGKPSHRVVYDLVKERARELADRPFTLVILVAPCVVRDANVGHQLASGNSSWCPKLESRTTHPTAGPSCVRSQATPGSSCAGVARVSECRAGKGQLNPVKPWNAAFKTESASYALWNGEQPQLQRFLANKVLPAHLKYGDEAGSSRLGARLAATTAARDASWCSIRPSAAARTFWAAMARICSGESPSPARPAGRGLCSAGERCGPIDTADHGLSVFVLGMVLTEAEGGGQEVRGPNDVVGRRRPRPHVLPVRLRNPNRRQQAAFGHGERRQDKSDKSDKSTKKNKNKTSNTSA